MYGVSADSLGLPNAEFLLVGTRHPSHWHQGPKEVGHVHLGATNRVIWGFSRFIRTTVYYQIQRDETYHTNLALTTKVYV